MKIKYIDYGIGFRVNDIIYLNRNLIYYPKLYKAIIKHEKEHSSKLDIKDLIIDINGKHLKKVKKDYYKFLLNNPKAWFMFIPVLKIENKWTIDVIMLIIWLIFLATLTFVIKIIK